jgi:hypothetical protein
MNIYRWNAQRLAELEDQVGRFRAPPSLRKRSQERSPMTDKQASNKESTRLYWPRMTLQHEINRTVSSATQQPDLFSSHSNDNREAA